MKSSEYLKIQKIAFFEVPEYQKVISHKIVVKKFLNFHNTLCKVCTVWKLQYFPITQILRGIKVGDFISPKIAFFEVPESQKVISHKI